MGAQGPVLEVGVRWVNQRYWSDPQHNTSESKLLHRLDGSVEVWRLTRGWVPRGWCWGW